jgi:hypothetical protein
MPQRHYATPPFYDRIRCLPELIERRNSRSRLLIDILKASADTLSQVGFSASPISIGDRQALAIEDATVLGFLFAYDDPGDLIETWIRDVDQAVAAHQFGLRRAGEKAWNTYVVLLASRKADYAQSVRLGAIEEDLVGTRKIVRADVADIAALHAALLPLLPLQTAPKLGAVDIAAEIRERTTELPARAVDAFLSSTDQGLVVQVLEEKP